MKAPITLFLIFTVIISRAQTEPALFEPGKISDGGAFGLTISPDSRTALWVKSNGKRDTLVVMESVKVKGKWQDPVVASFSSSSGNWKDIDPVFSPDGETILFQSTRPVPGLPQRQGFDIWAVKKQKKGWSEPFHLGNNINTDASESYASMSLDGSVYFMKENSDGLGKSDIYVSQKLNGAYQVPKNLGLPVNTPNRESNPFISPGGDYLIYFSDKPEGYGEVDLYISFKKGENWSVPQNLGNSVNTSQAEFCPFYHTGEKRLYFARQTKSNGRFIENLYSVYLDIQKLRDK